MRSQYAGLGRRIVDRLFQRAGLTYVEDKLTAALPRLARASLEDVMSAVGRSELKASDVARAMYPDFKEELAAARAKKKAESSAGRWFNLKRFKPTRSSTHDPIGPQPIPIRGINSDLPVRFAPNGGAVPGDRIVGILNPGEGITIYPIHSPSLSEYEDVPERWLDVRWDDDGPPQRFPAQLAVQSVNEPGSLAQITQVIAENDGNIDNIRMARRAPDFTDMTIDIAVYDLKHLTAIIAQLRALPVVARVERVNG